MGSEPEPDPPASTGRTRIGPRGRTAATAVAVGLAGFCSLVAWQLLLGSLALSVVGELTPVQEVLIGTVALGLGTGSTALLYLQFADRDRSFLDVELPSPADVGYALLGVVGLFGAMYGIQELFAAAGVRIAQHGITETAAGNPEVLLFLIPASWLLVGPGEELLFRNVVQKSLYAEFSRPAAVVVASLVFAAIHLPAYSTGTPLQAGASLVLVFVLSVVLGALFVRTGNVVVPAFVHGTFNAVQFAILYVGLTDGTGGALVYIL